MTRARIVKLVIIVGVLGGFIALGARPLIAWFTGEDIGGGATSKPTRATAGSFAIEAALRPDPPKEKGNTLLLRVLDAGGKPVEGADVTVTYVMPAMGSMQEMRGTANVAAKGDGRYEARFDLPMSGSWTIEVRVASGGASGSARFHMTVGASGLKVLGGGGSDGAKPTKPPELEEPALAALELPATALEALRRAFEATERVRVELAADRLDGVAAPAREAAQAIRAAQAALPGAGSEVADCLGRAIAAGELAANAKDLANARRAFGELNMLLIALAAADPRLQEGWHVFRCPMAEGFKKWFQRTAKLENPYMGQAMPTCGSASTWGVAPQDDGGVVSHEGHGHDGKDVSFYTCSMHPSVREKQAGTCPICSMDLSGVTYDEEESGVIVVDQARRDQIGVRTAKVVRTPFSRSIRAVGRIAYDENRLEDVTLKLGGFITKLHVGETGQPVKKGQVLFTLYSPELFAAQQEYLIAREGQTAAGSGRGDYLVRAAKKKLELWGLSRGQLEALAKRGTPLEDVPFYAPASGYIIEKNVVEGAAVMAGERLFRIAALDRVWVEAGVYEADLAAIKKGQRAVITLSYVLGKTFEGKVAYVYPYLDPVSRTGKVRIELANDKLELKPDMYATVAFQIELGPRLQIPITAVVYTGPRRLVFLDLGEGRLRPQEVTLGARNEDSVEVVRGLREGQTVVASGNFLIAAESRIRSNAKFWTEERVGESMPSRSQDADQPPAGGAR